ncbi:MAG: DUF305 domain-containing protein [Actinomycetota bacterium]|nr:DUF305 domain-containing protein [Actinomycetota bacterium]MDQ3709554.1 DUF305 domain-containing protein [Actinomycetota bacterium]
MTGAILATRKPVPHTGARRHGWDRLLAAAGAVPALIAVVAVTVVLARPDFPGDASAEAGFARDMGMHHAQAVEMAELVRPRTRNHDVRRLAVDIALTQQAQVGRMQGWLDVWGLTPTGRKPAMAWMGSSHTGLMPGMASQAQLNRLAGLRGQRADALFLRLMVSHHRAGVDTAQAVLARTQRPEVSELATAIVAGQRSEIAYMRRLLSETAADSPPGQGGDPIGSGHADHGDGSRGAGG